VPLDGFAESRWPPAEALDFARERAVGCDAQPVQRIRPDAISHCIGDRDRILKRKVRQPEIG
jgi:hypothetical protein